MAETKKTARTIEASKQGGWQRLLRRVTKVVTESSLPEVMLIASLTMARYLKNSDFSYPSEIILDIVLLGIFMTIVYYLLKLVVRSTLAAHIAGLFLAYGAYAYSYSFPTLQRYIDKLIPDSWTFAEKALLTYLGLAIVFGLLGFVVQQLFAHIKVLRTVPLLKFVVFVVCFIFVSQLVKVGARIWTIRHDLSYSQPALSIKKPAAAKSVATKEKPNIYYLLFDRYANSSTLQKIYDYDNSSLLNFLGEQGFVTRQNAYANYPFTMMSASSTLAMDYHAKIGAQFKNDAKGFQTAFPYRTIIDNPPIAQALKQNGYNYNQVSSWWDFTRNIPSADSEPTKSFEVRLLGKSYWLTDLQRDIFGKSILFPLLQHGIHVDNLTVAQYQTDRNPTQNFNAQMAAVKRIAQNSGGQAVPQFTFAHILSPHDPYIFDAQGRTPTYDSNRTDNGIDEYTKYTNQLTYLNTRIKDLVSTIRAKDPTAVIVIQADEGPYPKQFRGTLTAEHYYDPINLPLENMKQKFGVLASYYMPGVKSDTIAKNVTANVNAFRFVLDQYLGYELPMLPDCQFTVGDKFSLYNYQQVTGKLKGTENPTSCSQYKYAE